MSTTTDLESLHKEMVKYLQSVLPLIIQDKYRHTDNALKLYGYLLKLNTPLVKVLHDPVAVHEPAIDEGLTLQKSVITQLMKDYPPQASMHKEAAGTIKAVHDHVNSLRKEVPRPKVAGTLKTGK